MIRKSFSYLLLFFLQGCACCRYDSNGDVQEVVAERLQIDTSQVLVENLQQQPLTPESAMTIALLNSPLLQVKLQDVGIAQADLAQASLISNPLFDAYLRFPTHGQLNTQFALSQNLIELLIAPLRADRAVAKLENIKWRTAYEIVNSVFDVQEVFIKYQTEKSIQVYLQELASLAEIMSQLAQLQQSKGNLAVLEFELREKEYLESQLQILQNEKNIVHLQEHLTRLLGFSNSCWTAAPLAELPDQDPCIGDLEQFALGNRLDLEAARWALESNAREFPLTAPWTYSALNLGLSTEHEADGVQETGPTISMALPLFDYGQAARLKLDYQQLQNQQLLQAAEIHALAEVREASQQVEIARNIANRFKERLIPLQNSIVELSETYYGSMAMSVFTLLEQKKQQFALLKSYQEAKRDYWLALLALERALGGAL